MVILSLSQEEEIVRQQMLAMKKYFITYFQGYIVQNKDGSYKTLKYPNANYKLTDEMIIKHLKLQHTVGIFSNPHSAIFMCLDLDMRDASEKERQEVVKSIISSITRVGISRDYISVVFSGLKGFHIILNFDSVVNYPIARMFYDYILYNSHLTSTLLEQRPLPRQGVKLPLGLHKKSNKVSYFVDENFNEIKDPLHITKLKQFPAWLFNKIAIESELDEQASKSYKNNLKYKQTSESGCGLLSDEEIIEIETKGMQQKSTRNECVTQLAQYYRNQGTSKEDAIIKLDKWMTWQNKDLYNSSKKFYLREHRKVVEWAYKRQPLLIKSNEKFGVIKIYKNEKSKFSKIKDINSKKVLLVMMIHGKIYGDEYTHNFYMTYDQIMKHSGITSRTVISKVIKDLESTNMIKVIFRGTYKDRIPNMYMINRGSNNLYDKLYINKDDKYMNCYTESVQKLLDII